MCLMIALYSPCVRLTILFICSRLVMLLRICQCQLDQSASVDLWEEAVKEIPRMLADRYAAYKG